MIERLITFPLRCAVVAMTTIVVGFPLGVPGHGTTTVEGKTPSDAVVSAATSRSDGRFADLPAAASAGVVAGALPDQQVPTSVFLPWVGTAAGVEVRMVSRLGGTTRAILAIDGLVIAGIDRRVALFETGRDGTMHPVSETFAPTSEVIAIAGTAASAFVADSGGTLMSIDLSDSEQPRLLRARQMNGTVHDVAVAGSTLAVSISSATFKGLHLFDASDPSSLVQLGALGYPQSLVSLSESAGLLFALTDGGSFLVIDPADAGAPEVIGRLDLSVAGASCVAVDGGVAVVGHPGGLVAVDIADPAVPSLGAELPLTDAAVAVSAAKGRALVGHDAGLTIVRVASAHDLTAAAQVTVPGGLLAVGADVEGHTAYGGGPQYQVAAWDVDDPEHPAALGVHVALYDAVDLTVVRDGLLVVTNDPPGLAMVVGEPGTPLRVASTSLFTRITEPIRPGEVHMAAHLYYGFVLLFDSLTSYDTSTPTRIETRRTRAQPWAGGLALSGSYLYVARDGIAVVDAGSASDLPEVGRSVDQVGTGRAIAVEGRRAYLAQRSIRAPDNPTDLWVFDVASPRTPVRIGVGQNIADPTALTVVDGYVYVSGAGMDDAHGLWVYDATDPNRITPVGRVLLYPTVGLPGQVVRDRGRLYLAEEAIVDPYRGTLTGRFGVHVIDVRDPARPKSVTFVPFPGPIGGIVVQDGIVYVAARAYGVVAMEVGQNR